MSTCARVRVLFDYQSLTLGCPHVPVSVSVKLNGVAILSVKLHLTHTHTRAHSNTAQRRLIDDVKRVIASVADSSLTSYKPAWATTACESIVHTTVDIYCILHCCERAVKPE